MNYHRLVSRHVYHHKGHIFFSSAFHTARVVWVLPHNQALGGACKTQLFLVRDLRGCFDRLPGGRLIKPNEQVKPGVLFSRSCLYMGSLDVGTERNQTTSGTVTGILAS